MLFEDGLRAFNAKFDQLILNIKLDNIMHMIEWKRNVNASILIIWFMTYVKIIIILIYVDKYKIWITMMNLDITQFLFWSMQL